jgi:hypothetical protein
VRPEAGRISSAVEQRFCKPKVGGSIPSSGTTFSMTLLQSHRHQTRWGNARGNGMRRFRRCSVFSPTETMLFVASGVWNGGRDSVPRAEGLWAC